jgi:hypothetical protein
MWGQSWGQMIWGRGPAVPALGFWSAVLLGAVLAVIGTRYLRSVRPRGLGWIALMVAWLIPASVWAVPFTFTNGTVADATQVNANFAALTAAQGVAPSTPSALVDLVANSPCPSGGGNGGVALDNQVQPDGIRTFFSIPSGQMLLLTNIAVTVSLTTASAGHTVLITLNRASSTTFNDFELRTVTLDSRGSATLSIPLGNGSPFKTGTTLCVFAQDLNTVTTVGTFPFAHGFLVPAP